jgi:hypothetical protein
MSPNNGAINILAKCGAIPGRSHPTLTHKEDLLPPSPATYQAFRSEWKFAPEEVKVFRCSKSADPCSTVEAIPPCHGGQATYLSVYEVILRHTEHLAEAERQQELVQTAGGIANQTCSLDTHV